VNLYPNPPQGVLHLRVHRLAAGARLLRSAVAVHVRDGLHARLLLLLLLLLLAPPGRGPAATLRLGCQIPPPPIYIPSNLVKNL
jgi:hypothetical protein